MFVQIALANLSWALNSGVFADGWSCWRCSAWIFFSDVLLFLLSLLLSPSQHFALPQTSSPEKGAWGNRGLLDAGAELPGSSCLSHCSTCAVAFLLPRVHTLLCPMAIGCSGKPDQTQAVCFMLLQLTRVSCSDSLHSIGR